MSLVAFLLAWAVFTFGPGFAITARLTRSLDPLRRAAVALGAGTAAAPAIINLLGRLNLVALYPVLALMLAGIGWLLSNEHDRTSVDRSELRRDLAAAGFVVALAVALGVVVFAHRIGATSEGTILYGEYDTADLTWYAAEASEASHTIPPMASYYSGHKLNAAYYAHLVFALIHRFAGVPLLSIYFAFAWPTMLALSALTGFVLVRAIAGRGVAVLAISLVLIGSDFSYLAVWLFPQVQQAGNWDYVLWPTNFLSPTMQILHYNTWGLSLPLFFTVLYSIIRSLQTRSRGWVLLSGVLIAVLFEFRPFAWVVLMGGLGAGALFPGGDRFARWTFVATAALGTVLTTPFLYAAATIAPEDRRTRLVVEFFPLVKRMLIKTEWTDAFTRAAAAIAPSALQTPIYLLLATVVFLAIGLGVRWLGVPGVWRAIWHRSDEDRAAWSLLAWCVVVGVAIPFVIATDPYVDTLNFYVTGLYLLWIFTAIPLVDFARRHPPAAGGAVIATAVALTLPSSVHYLERRWNDRDRPGRTDISAAELRIADYLRSRTDPETTVILHSRPLSPSLTAILSERRIVLGWDVTYSAVGGQARMRDVNRFFTSADGNPDAAYETVPLYSVTHVIVRDEDRVHPAVLDRLHLVMKFPGAALYSVPPSPSP